MKVFLWTEGRTANVVNRGDGEHRAWPLGFTDLGGDFLSNDDAVLKLCHSLCGDILHIAGGMVHKAQQRLLVAFWDLRIPVQLVMDVHLALFPLKLPKHLMALMCDQCQQ